ncbi:MAG: DUF4062 domain-containing protein [Ruminococcaceae bacterium]|nr:DUF4062 domain-containing protein [Oscillospiraceae bacterium]
MMATKKEKKPISIFVSSTYKDLASCRAEVEKQLVSLEQAVKGMEYFGSSSDTPLAVCKAKLRECKLMILLLGVSYGSVEATSGKSYTELEYDYATELNIPILAYEADLSSPNLGIPYDAIDYVNKNRLDAFKEKVEGAHLISRFTSIDDLGKRIAHDVPAELEKLSVIDEFTTRSGVDASSVDDAALRDGADKFERFWLRPQRLAGRIVPVRLRINKKFSGWKVKDELIRAVGCTVGDCITTEVSVQLGNNIIDDNGDTDLFADGDGADWLLDQVANSGVVEGCILDCFVRLIYCRAPVGGNNRMVNKASLVFVSGIQYVGVDNNYVLSADRGSVKNTDISRFLEFLQQ